MCQKVVGVTGVEPVTLRLSSACSNQLSYTPRLCAGALWRGKPAGWPVNRARSAPALMADWLAEPKPGGRRLVELRRVELLTYSLQSYRSTN